MSRLVTTPSTAPLPLTSRTAGAYGYLIDRIRSAPGLSFVRSWIVTAAPVDFEAIPNARPAVFFVPTEGTSALQGSGTGGPPTLDTRLTLTVGLALDGSDPTDLARLWEAIERAVWGGYRDQCEAMWDAGITGFLPGTPAHAPTRPKPDSRFFVSLGSLTIQL